MKGIDKFLLAIVAGVVVLVGVVLVLAVLRPNRPSYQPDDTPEGVAHNYLLALQLEEYERAYSYLSPSLPGYPPDAGTFEHDVQNNRWSFGYGDDDVSLAIEAVNINGDRAKVVVRETRFYRGDTFDMTLRPKEGTWKVSDSERYWIDCWESSKGCK
jgi:hypothetical protein